MSIGDDYIAAVRSGNTALANYLAQGLAVQAGIDINANQVEAAPLSVINGLPQLPSLPGQADTSNTGAPFSLSPWTSADTQLFKNLWNWTPSQSSAGKALSSAGSALDFITDIPRVVTSVLGLILIIAGIFALSRGPAVSIVGAAEGTKAHLGDLKAAGKTIAHPIKAITP